MDAPELQAAAAGASTWVVLFIASFALPVVYMVWVRNTERHRREPLGAVLRTFLWGAVFSVIIGVVLSLVLFLAFSGIAPLYVFLARRFNDPQTVLLALVVAPLAEEFAKGLAARSARKRMLEREDGLVYGAAAGLGFSATENLVYGIGGLIQGGLAASIAVIAFRSISSSLLHASASGVFGYGIAKHHLDPARVSYVPYYLAAVVMHSTFNFLASFGDLYEPTYGPASYLIGFAAAAVFALVAISAVRGKIRAVDRAT